MLSPLRGSGPAHGQLALASLDHVTRTGQHALVITLTAALAELLQRDGPWTEALTRHATAAQAARRFRDRLGQANALSNLGDVRKLTGDNPGAAGDVEQALAIYRDLGSRLGQAGALTYLGSVRRETGDTLARPGTWNKPWIWPACSASERTRLRS